MFISVQDEKFAQQLSFRDKEVRTSQPKPKAPEGGNFENKVNKFYLEEMHV